MLDPLLATTVNADILTLKFDEFENGAKYSNDSSRGKKAQYLIPKHRLAHTDAAFGRVVFEPHGESDDHCHPGDELAFVRLGDVEVRFGQSGIRTTLSEGEIIHFHAEARHQIVNLNPSKPAEVLIVRFYQIDARTRLDLWTELQSSLLDRSKTLDPHAVGWLRQVLPNYESSPSGNPIVDSLGFARFLQECGKLQDAFGQPVGSLQTLERERLENSDPNTIRQLTESDLAMIASAYGVKEFLLRAFRSPGVPGAVILRPSDFETVDGVIEGEQGVEYMLPCRNLARV